MPSYTTSSTITPWTISNDYRIAALQGDLKDNNLYVWLDLAVPYSFPDGPTHFHNGTGYGQNNEVGAGWSVLTASQKASARAALEAWSAVSGITFYEVGDDLTVGDLRIALTSAVPTASYGHAYQPSPNDPESGDVWLTSRWSGQSFGNAPSQTNGQTFVHDPNTSIKYMTLLHEVGHALGLSHPFTESGTTRYTAPLPVMEDTFKTTVMGYSPHAGTLGAPYRGIPTTPMPYDILAIQQMYGANLSHNATDTVYRFDMSDVRLETIWDAGGHDTIVATNRQNLTKLGGFGGYRGVQIDLRPGTGMVALQNDGTWGGQGGNHIGFMGDYAAKAYVNEGTAASNPTYGLTYLNDTSNIFIAFHTWIENAVTTDGDDRLIGNDLNNRLTGNGGNDRIDGQGGVDTSVYVGNASNYTVAETVDGFNVRANFTETVRGWIGSPFTFKINPTDLLRNIERIEFSDVSLALDLSGNAGTVAKILGAVFGPTAVFNEIYAGIGLYYIDAGMTYESLMQLAIDARLGGGASHQAVVDLLYTNVVGVVPGDADRGYFVGLLDSGAFTVAGLGVMAADIDLNVININLVGLAQQGLEYVPFDGA